MSGLSRIALGGVPANKQGVDSCVRFKREMLKRLGRVDGAYLMTVEGDGKRWMEAVYLADEPGAQEWAELARDASKDVWAEVKRTAGKEAARA